jgi:hypothetical protein
VQEIVPGTFWAWIAALAGSIYTGYGAQFYTAGLLLSAASKFVRGAQKDKEVWHSHSRMHACAK